VTSPLADSKNKDRSLAAYVISFLAASLAATLAVGYLSKRLRRQGQTEGVLTNTKVSLVSTLKNATFFNQSAID